MADGRLRERVFADKQQPFDLAKRTLRLTVYRISRDDHVLTLVAHHITWDLLSADIFVNEMPRLYGEECGGPTADLIPLAANYLDFVEWQREFLASPAATEMVDTWQACLSGVPPLLDLPLDRRRAATRRIRSGSHVVRLEPETATMLKALGASAFRTLMAMFQIVLYRFTHSEDFVIGTAAGNRFGDFVPVAGNFVNMLPLRFRPNPGMTISDALDHVDEVTSRASKLRNLPLDKVLERIRPPRDAAVPTLFQVGMGLHRMARGGAISMIPGASWRARLGPMDAEAFPILQHATQLDLELIAAEDAGGFLCQFKFNTDLFETDTIIRIARAFVTISSVAARNPMAAVDDIDIVTDDDRTQMLVDWSSTDAPIPPRAIHELVEAQIDRCPEALAICDEHDQITYGDLERRANAIAQALNPLVRSNDIVAICMDRSAAAIVAMLGVLKAGGAFVYLDPHLPRDRVEAIIRDARVTAGVVDAAYEDRLEKLVGTLHLLDANLPAAAETPKRAAAPTSPSNLAYAIFTSGSSGRPKGVALEHRGLVNTALWMSREYGFAPSMRATQLISMSFDAAMTEIWPVLISGGALHVVDDATRLSPPALIDFLAAQRITSCCMPTALAEAVLREERGPSSLKTLFVGGEQLHRHARERPFQVINLYGPTEYTVNATHHPVEAGPSADVPPIGKPIANTRAYVLDSAGKLVPIGVIGELHLGGAGLARGYVGREDLTSERFVDDPFRSDGSKLYETGDLVRWRSSGVLEYVGRLDQQVKIRGFRIEPGEIEAALLGHRGIREAIVIARSEGQSHARLVAYVAGDDIPDSAELRAYLRTKLPEYMVPTSTVKLTTLPTTPNGKVDRNALPKPTSIDEAAVVETPSSPTEDRVHAIWTELLHVPNVDVATDFYDVGGDSLLAMELLAVIKREFGRTPPVASGSVRTTIRGQAEWLDSDADDEGRAGPELVSLGGGDRGPALVLFHALGGGLGI